MSDVLSVNIGSSSLKFALYSVSGDTHVDRAHASGLIEGLEPGGNPVLKLSTQEGSTREPVPVAALQRGIDAALAQLRRAVDTLLAGRQLVAVAHRVVHGGIHYCEPVRVDETVLEDLARLNPLAPLHQPHNLAGIRACMAAFPDTPHGSRNRKAFRASRRVFRRRGQALWVSWAFLCVHRRPPCPTDAGCERQAAHGPSGQWRQPVRRGW